MGRRKQKKRAHPPAEAETEGTASASQDEPPAKKPKTFDERFETATTSPEDVLKEQMKHWRSKFYGHFKMPPEIIIEDGVVKYRFWCLKHPSKFITRVRTDTSTSNLSDHVEACEPEREPGQTSISQFAHGSTYSKADFRFLTTVWITKCHRPFAIVEDEPLQDMFRMLYAPVEIPSGKTVSRDVKEVFIISKTAVAAFLQSQKAAIHIMFDGWTAPNIISFLGVVVSFERGGEIHALLLDFIRLHKRHTGKYLAQKMHECLDSFGISDKILVQAADNASNNDTMIKDLGRRLSGPAGPHTRVRCLCHILNLCVKAILQPFKKSKKSSDSQADSPEDNDDGSEDEADDRSDSEDDESSDDEEEEEEVDEDREAYDEEVLAELMQSADSDLADNDRLFGQKTLTKLHNLTKAIFHSPLLRDDLKRLCVEHGIKPLGVVRSVPTRWNSVAMTSRRAIYLKAPLNELVAMPEHNKSRSAKLLRYKLSTEEWVIIEQLDTILGDFLEATERMSVRSRPLLHDVIPVIDLLEGMLETASDDWSLKPAVRAAASLGRTVLNKYYSKTDESIVYRCAMILHPKYKTAYFKRAGWLPDWIDTAISLLRTQWQRYKPQAQAGGRAVSSSKPRGTFAALDEDENAGDSDALEEYLNTPVLTSVVDPLKHWNALDPERTPLARMALDFLSAPATSVDAERSFSRGALTVSKLRRNLSDESTRAAVVLGEWLKVPGLVPKDTVVQTFAEKGSRKGKTAGKEVIQVDSDLDSDSD